MSGNRTNETISVVTFLAKHLSAPLLTFVAFMMPFFSESAFTIVDFVAQRLKYVGWIPMVAAFLILSLSSDKERQFTRLAKISRFVYLGATALYTSYFILHPKVKYCSLLFLSFFATGPLIFFLNPIIWLVYGDKAISLDAKAYRSHQLAIEEKVKSKVFRHICFGVMHFFGAPGALGFGILFNMSMAIPVKDEVLTGEINTYAAGISSFFCLVSLGYMIHMKNKYIQRRLTEEFSAEGSVAKTKAEFANEKVPDQGDEQV